MRARQILERLITEGVAVRFVSWVNASTNPDDEQVQAEVLANCYYEHGAAGSLSDQSGFYADIDSITYAGQDLLPFQNAEDRGRIEREAIRELKQRRRSVGESDGSSSVRRVRALKDIVNIHGLQKYTVKKGTILRVVRDFGPSWPVYEVQPESDDPEVTDIALTALFGRSLRVHAGDVEPV